MTSKDSAQQLPLWRSFRIFLPNDATLVTSWRPLTNCLHISLSRLDRFLALAHLSLVSIIFLSPGWSYSLQIFPLPPVSRPPRETNSAIYFVNTLASAVSLRRVFTTFVLQKFFLALENFTNQPLLISKNNLIQKVVDSMALSDLKEGQKRWSAFVVRHFYRRSSVIWHDPKVAELEEISCVKAQVVRKATRCQWTNLIYHVLLVCN